MMRLTRASRAHLAKLSVDALDEVLVEIIGIRNARREAEKQCLKRQMIELVAKRGHRIEDVLGLAA